ncbi:MAG TPA: hypothetical protein VGG62_03780, partial [Terracidiphilus sp.]
HPQLAAFTRKKHVRNLDKDSRAIARLRIATGRSPVRQVQQNLEALADDRVRSFSADAGHQPHAARVMLVLRMVKSLPSRDT